MTARQRLDFELLLNGGFAPLTSFLTQADYESVISSSRLTQGTLWPMPITLDVSEEFANNISLQDKIALCDDDNALLAYLTITDKWQPNKTKEAEAIFGTTDIKHPAVNYLFNQAGNWYISGELKLVQMPVHHDFKELRLTPQSLKQQFSQLGLETVIAFQTRNPIHRAHMELTLRAAQKTQGNILLHPVVGMTKPGDIDYFTRVRCYQKLLNYYPKNKAFLSLLPLAMRMGGPKEALWHAIIRKNYGCTHFIVGRDHAGPGINSSGKAFYDPLAAQQLAAQHQEEIGIKVLPFQEMVYVKERKQYCERSEIQAHETGLAISGTELRRALHSNHAIPEWFSFPEIIDELRSAYPPKHQQGFTIFFTGLSSSGKTTLAKALMAKFLALGKRNVTLLDGDLIRRILANELGFSKADRDLNIRRIGFVASEITKTGGIVLCAAIAPYQAARDVNRSLISQCGGYIEVYLATPLAVCEARDRKGIYAKARARELQGLTGVDDPYEVPANPEITIDTSDLTIEESANKIIEYLCEEGYLQKHICEVGYL